MTWDQRFVKVLQDSKSGFDQTPDWRSALGLYKDLNPSESHQLDRAVLAMIDQEYRNPESIGEHDPFADVMTSLPAGMDPDDLLCVEAAVMVAGERGLGEALFRLNRLMRAPRWHALFPRLLWLNYEGIEAQRKLALTPAGRCLGAVLGMALASCLRPGPEGAFVTQISPTLHEAFSRVQDGKALTDGPYSRWFLAISGSPQDQEGQTISEVISGQVNRTGFPDPPIKGDLEESLLPVLNVESEETRLGVGALAGAHFGPLGSPRRWTAPLAGRERLEAVAEALWAIRARGSQEESEGY